MIFFIPIFPTGTQTEYVECHQCGAAFQPSILDRIQGDRERLDHFEQAVINVFLKMILADGRVEIAEKDMFRRVLEHYSSQRFSDAQIEAGLARVKQERKRPDQYLAGIGANLNDEAKEQLMLHGFFIAKSDGFVMQEELDLLLQIGTALGMSRLHAQGVIDHYYDIH